MKSIRVLLKESNTFYSCPLHSLIISKKRVFVSFTFIDYGNIIRERLGRVASTLEAAPSGPKSIKLFNGKSIAGAKKNMKLEGIFEIL